MKGQCLPYDKVPKLFVYVCYFLFKIGLIGSQFLVKSPRRVKCLPYGKNLEVIYTFSIFT